MYDKDTDMQNVQVVLNITREFNASALLHRVSTGCITWTHRTVSQNYIDKYITLTHINVHNNCKIF